MCGSFLRVPTKASPRERRPTIHRSGTIPGEATCRTTPSTPLDQLAELSQKTCHRWWRAVPSVHARTRGGAQMLTTNRRHTTAAAAVATAIVASVMVLTGTPAAATVTPGQAFTWGG